MYDYSSTQVEFDKDDTDRILKFAHAFVDEADLAEDGYETVPHITVKYGLHTGNANEVRRVLRGQAPVRAVLGKTSIFEPEGKDYDVVKLDVESKGLHRLNGRIARMLKVTDTFPTYKPHVTLAYVKRGRGKRYVGNVGLEGFPSVFDEVCFCRKSGDKVVIALKK